MENQNPSCHIKPLLPNDVGQAMELSGAEGWNQTKADWELLVQNHQNVCLAAVSDGKIVGTATAMNYSGDVAWIGMVLVNREHRGRGISKMLLSSLFEQLHSCKSIKLDATPAGQPVYQKFGFKDEYLVHRMTAVPFSSKAILAEGQQVPEPIHPGNLSEIIDFDCKVFGANRKQLVEFLLRNYPEKGWMAKQHGEITGFALGREGTRFHQIGPVMASTTEQAKTLIREALKGLEGQPVVVDVLDDKHELIEWLVESGFTKQRHFIRMYQDENPFPGIPENQFLICGPEFG
jgi:predicted GNAT family N-acyltransferase